MQTLTPVEGGVDELSTTQISDRERIEIYDFSATYQGENFDMEAFYHTPRFHYGYEGDFFGLIIEATDIEGQDIWNAKAPAGLEFIGKGALDGLTVIGGPEIFWGANPKIVLKYDNRLGDTFPFLGGRLGNTQYTVMLSEDVARQDVGANATGATQRETTQATFYTETEFSSTTKLELGGIIAAPERVDEQYDRINRAGDIILDDIDFEDTLGFKAKFSFPLFGGLGYLATHHAGLVADAGFNLREFGTRLPYSGLGNKEEYEFGLMMNFGNLMVFPRLLYRQNKVDANPSRDSMIINGVLNPGLVPRDRDADPFGGARQPGSARPPSCSSLTIPPGRRRSISGTTISVRTRVSPGISV